MQSHPFTPNFASSDTEAAKLVRTLHMDDLGERMPLRNTSEPAHAAVFATAQCLPGFDPSCPRLFHVSISSFYFFSFFWHF
jgi:hypothetical protein